MKLRDFTINNICVSVYQFDIIDERMYVIRDGKEVLIIDPYEEKGLLEEIDDDSEVYVYITHEHFDHFSGVNFLRDNFSAKVGCSAKCADILNSNDNGTSRFPFLFIGDKEMFNRVRAEFSFPYRPIIDFEIPDGYERKFKSFSLKAIATPGHSKGGMTYIVNDDMLFSGDNLLGNGQEIRSVDSDLDAYKNTLGKYQKMTNKGVYVLPGHGEICLLDDVYKTIRSYI